MEKLITVFGDSIARGVMTDGNKRYFGTSAAEIYAKKHGVNIDNRSVYGQSLKRLREKNELERYYSAKTENEKVCVIELGGNDADFYWQDVAKNPKGEHCSKTTPEEFFSMYSATLKALKEKCERVYVCTLVPVISRRYFDNVISKISDGEKVLEFFNGDVTTIYRHQEMMNEAVLCAAFENRTKIIDVRKSFLQSLDLNSLMCFDGIHPNEKGQCLIAKACEKSVAVC